MKQLTLLALAALFSSAQLAHSAKSKIATHDLLVSLHHINQEEISAGHLASQRAESAKVKAYAEHLVKDHQAADAKVAKLAKTEGIALGANPGPSSLMTQLTAASGPEFDKEFVTAMDKGHGDAIRLLEDSEISDGKARALAQTLLPELKSHRRMAKTLEPIAEKEGR